MEGMEGAIVLCCGDSRNGSVPKALKAHFNWPADVRVKTISVAGGAHSHDIDHDFVLRQAAIFTSVLLSKGATKISLVLTDHDDCGYVKGVASRQIETYWTDPVFLEKVWAIAQALQAVYITTVGYVDHHVPTVRSTELRLRKVETVKREAA